MQALSPANRLAHDAWVRWGPASLLLVVGCSAPEALWMPPPPVDANARSLVFMFADEARAEFAVAATLDGGALAQPLNIDDSEWNEVLPDRPRVRALYYPYALSELELRPGRLEGNAARSCRLETPLAAQVADASEGADKSWIPGEATLFESEHAVLLGDQPCRRPDLCHGLEVRTLQLPTQPDVTAMIALDGTSALAFNGYQSAAFRLTYDEAVTSTVHHGLPGFGNFLSAEGELWLGGADGRIVHGPIGGPFTSASIPDQLHYSVGAIDVDPDTGDVLALSVYDPREHLDPRPFPAPRIALHRLRDGVWAQLHHSEISNGNTTAARIVRYGPGRAAMVYRDYTILFLDGDRVQQRSIAGEGLLKPFVGSVASLHPGELYFGASNGLLYLDREGRGELEPVPEGSLSASIDAILPWGDSLFLGGSEGYFLEYDPQGSACDQQIRAPSDVEVLVRVGDQILASGGNLDQLSNNFVGWITIDRP